MFFVVSSSLLIHSQIIYFPIYSRLFSLLSSHAIFTTVSGHSVSSFQLSVIITDTSSSISHIFSEWNLLFLSLFDVPEDRHRGNAVRCQSPNCVTDCHGEFCFKCRETIILSNLAKHGPSPKFKQT